MSLFVGASGWAYKEWKPDFYPVDIPQRSFLEYWNEAHGLQVNVTFRRMQSDETIAKWRDTVPDPFRFSTKAHRGLTHTKQLTPSEEKREFFNAFVKLVGGLDGKLGVILWQFPPFRKRDDEDLAGLSKPSRAVHDSRSSSATTRGQQRRLRRDRQRGRYRLHLRDQG